MMFKRNKLSRILVLILITGVSIVYSQDVSSGIGAIPSGQTWSICSKIETNFISFDMRMVKTSQEATPGFGTNEVGNRPRPSPIEGLLIFTLNFTQLRSLVDPTLPAVNYREELSCAKEPVKECGKTTNPPLLVQQIFCIAITNPNPKDSKFTASISFDQNAKKPLLVIPPEDGDEPTSSSKAPTKTDSGPTDTTKSFYTDSANRLENNSFIYLFIISLFFAVFMSYSFK